MKDHFNKLIEDKDTLGTILFGDVDDFRMTIEDLDPDHKKTYVGELISAEVISPGEE